MSALFVFLLQLLQATGFPINAHTGVVVVTPAAPRASGHDSMHRDGGSDESDGLTFIEATPPCDISNGF